jgi:hypothetical protein
MLALALAACGGGGDNEEEDNGDGGRETPAATKTVEADETAQATKTPKATKTTEPSGDGGGASFEDIPVYPGADKVGDWEGDYSLPLLGEDLDVEDYEGNSWAEYETDDSADDVIDFYRDKMPDNGWNEERWWDTSFVEDVGWGSYTRDGGDRAAWVFITGTEDDKTQIVIGTGSK